MIAVIGLKVVIVCKPMGRETGLAKCFNLILLTFFFHVVVFSQPILISFMKIVIPLILLLLIAVINFF